MNKTVLFHGVKKTYTIFALSAPLRDKKPLNLELGPRITLRFIRATMPVRNAG